jgi:hypothetical protein
VTWILSLVFGIRKMLTTAFAWAIRNPMPAIAALCLVLAGFQTWRLSGARNDLSRAVEALRGEKQAHRDTIAGYVKAQREAEAKQASNLARVAKEQEIINDETKRRFMADTGDWKRRFGRLRADSHGGRASAACVSPVPDAPGRTDGPGSDPGDATVAVRIDDLETLVGNSLVAQGLQRWVAEQGAVVTSPE